MNKEEIREKFEKNVNYLRRIVPPDDIYMFAEQTFMATLYFLKKWSDVADIEDECRKCPLTRKWVANILGLQKMKDEDMDIQLDLNMESLDEIDS